MPPRFRSLARGPKQWLSLVVLSLLLASLPAAATVINVRLGDDDTDTATRPTGLVTTSKDTAGRPLLTAVGDVWYSRIVGQRAEKLANSKVSMEFRGTGGLKVTPGQAANIPFQIQNAFFEVWFQAAGIDSAGCIAYCGNSGANGVGFFQNYGNLEVVAGGIGSSFSTPITRINGRTLPSIPSTSTSSMASGRAPSHSIRAPPPRSPSAWTAEAALSSAA